jgi:hypothetical protein
VRIPALAESMRACCEHSYVGVEQIEQLPSGISLTMSRIVQAMRNAFIASVLFSVLASTSAQKSGSNITSGDPPTFNHYPSIVDFKGNPAKPLLVTPREHAFRTQIREQASTGPNFAGHFTIAKWGCGSPCIAFVIVDSKTGNVFDPGFSLACADGNVMDATIDFKLTSHLIIATGFSKETGCGRDFFEWDGKRLKLIRFEPSHSDG